MEPSSLLLSFFFLLSSFVFGLAVKQYRRRDSRPLPLTGNYVPLKSYPIIGNLPHLIRNGPTILEWSSDLLLASPTGTAVVAPIVFISNPSNIEHVLRSRFDNYPKDPTIADSFRDFLGDGIFNVNGELWRLQRKIASHEFNTKSIRSFIIHNLRRKCCETLVPLLCAAAESAEIVDLQETLDRFAFDNVCSMVFGHDPRSLDGDQEGLEFIHAFEEVSELIIVRFGNDHNLLWRLKRILQIGSERRLTAALRVVRGYADKFVKLRQKEGGNYLLSRFAADEEGFSDELLRDVLMCFVLAGRDTTPSALTWFFWFLSSNPQIIEKIRREVEFVRKLSGSRKGEAFSLDELREMQYLHAALSESMRIYPPVPLLSRTAVTDDELPDGTVVRKGWLLMYNSFAMGRMHSIWGEDCKDFRPERWLDDDGVFRPASPFKYPVFHAGPRVCLGKEMAYLQMKAVAACLLEVFDIEVAGDCAGVHRLSITLRMKGGLPLRFKARPE